jgi:hypothetical protein
MVITFDTVEDLPHPSVTVRFAVQVPEPGNVWVRADDVLVSGPSLNVQK